MARRFEISALFTAINHMSAPIAAMGRDLSRFARVVSSTSSTARRDFGAIDAAIRQVTTRMGIPVRSTMFTRLEMDGRRAASRLQTSLNSINLNRLHSNLRRVSSDLSNLGHSATRLGAIGMAAGGFLMGKSFDIAKDDEVQKIRLKAEFGDTNGEKIYKQSRGFSAENIGDAPEYNDLLFSFGKQSKKLYNQESGTVDKSVFEAAANAAVYMGKPVREAVESMKSMWKGNPGTDDNLGMVVRKDKGMMNVQGLGMDAETQIRIAKDLKLPLYLGSGSGKMHKGERDEGRAYSTDEVEKMKASGQDISRAHFSENIEEKDVRLKEFTVALINSRLKNERGEAFYKVAGKAFSAQIEQLQSRTKNITIDALHDSGMFDSGMRVVQELGDNIKSIMGSANELWKALTGSEASGQANATLSALADTIKALSPNIDRVTAAIKQFKFDNPELFEAIKSFGMLTAKLALLGIGLNVLMFAISPLKIFLSAMPLIVSQSGIALAALGAIGYKAFKSWDAIKGFLPTFKQLKSVVDSVSESLAGFYQRNSGLIEFLGATTVAFAGLKIMSIISDLALVLSRRFVMLGVSSFAFVAASAPLLAVAGTIALIYTNWGLLSDAVGKPIGNKIGAGIYDAVQLIKSSWESLKNILGAPVRIGKFIGSKIYDMQSTKAVWSRLKAFLRAPIRLGRFIGAKIYDVITKIKAAWGQLKAFLATPVSFSGVFNSAVTILNGVIATLKGLWNSLKAFFTTPIDFSAAWSGLTSGFNSAIASVSGAWSAFKSSLNFSPSLPTPGKDLIKGGEQAKSNVLPFKKMGNDAATEYKNFKQTSYAPDVNVHINQNNMHHVSNSGAVKTVSQNNIKGGVLRFNNNTKTGQSARTA